MNRALPMVALAAALSAGCGPSAPSPAPAADPTADPGYAQDAQRLSRMDRTAEQFFQNGKTQEAAAIISSAQPVQTRLLAAPRPTLEAMEAIGDLDQIYGRMLIYNGYFGEARMLFQKNVTRWKNWKPQTPETERRLSAAQAAIAECDRHMGG